MPNLPKNLNIKFSESPPKVINEALEEPLKFTLDDLDEALPNIMEKGSPNVKEIFQEEAPKEKPKIDLTKNEDPSLNKDQETGEVAATQANFVYEKPVKLTKKGKPRKQMSEEQKQKARDNLKRARENKLAKKKKLEDAKPKPVVPIVEEKKVVEPTQEPEPKQQVAQAPTQGKYLSKEDLESSTLNAILSYEKIRKERKAVKKEQKIIQAEKDKILNVARSHLHSSGWQSSAGRFNGCY